MADAQGFGRERSTSYEIGARYSTDDLRFSVAAKGNVRVGNTNLRPQFAVRRTGSLYFDSANMLKQEGYTLLDASVAWNVSDNVELVAYM